MQQLGREGFLKEIFLTSKFILEKNTDRGAQGCKNPKKLLSFYVFFIMIWDSPLYYDFLVTFDRHAKCVIIIKTIAKKCKSF